jgi:3-methyladenine DNA glycosylase/8-oxoguanine DNA glycosylase
MDINLKCPDPDHLAPFAVRGFEALRARQESQIAIKTQLKNRERQLRDKLVQMSSFYDTQLKGQLERIYQNSKRINQALVSAIEREEVEKMQGRSLTAEEKQLLEKFESLKQELNMPGTFLRKIRELKEKTKKTKVRKASLRLSLDPKALESLVKVITTNQESIDRLERVTKGLMRTTAQWDALDFTAS